jgi:hypothetical protein
VTTFFSANTRLAQLLPTIKRNISLQKELENILPAIFHHCEVLNVVGEELVLSAPNASIASKLKQQLPKLQLELQKRGRQINAIKIKVQVTRAVIPPAPVKQAILSPKALQAFDNLKRDLEAGAQNSELQEALGKLLKRRGV